MNKSPNTARHSTEEWLQEIGTGLRDRRIRADLTQEDLARRAGISVGSVKHLETGAGANLTSLVKVVRVLGAEDWLAALSPAAQPAVSPMQLLRAQRRTAPARQRVRKSHSPKAETPAARRERGLGPR
jgi:transcriptional regulator with XRE-family HTH domain